ncbi:hypothetical protein K461DRAFT_276451 [Myriangium duriaei CBS 260.36]|uniref:ABM domain-containing protein n=1 Tax=Myriangium duriaei CBS 260.36 TaxID=1168546 RepID=A0A9P4J5Z1_9PEZI|nr:hypothetical protein K461DRAFT_276451 [Myriangium duriaei CBS 260.36]
MVYTLVVHAYAKDDKDAISKVHNKLKEASLVYNRDKGTLDWFVMQDVSDPRAFTVVERFEDKSSIKYHTDNPYYATFGEYIKPLLEKPLEVRHFEELHQADLSFARRGSINTIIDDKVKVEKDDELWKKVDAHQSHLREQGNY